MFTNINSVITVMIEQDKIHYNKNQTRLGSFSQGADAAKGTGARPPPLGSDFKHGYNYTYYFLNCMLITF